MKIRKLFLLALAVLMLAVTLAPDTRAAGLADVTITGTQGHHTGNIIRWEAVEGAQLYQVFRLEGKQWVLLKNTGSLAYKDTDAQVGVRHYYKVRARRGSEMSSLNIPSASAVRPLADVVMSGTTAHVTGNIVRWQVVTGAKLYQVYRRAASESNWTLLTNTGSLAYKDTSAQVGVRYYYKVRARLGELMSSLNIQAVSAVRPIGNVTGTTAQAHETGIILRWEPVFGAKVYQIFRLESGKTSWTQIAGTGASSYKDTSAQEGVRYYYKVRAVNGSQVSSLSVASVSAVRPKKAASAKDIYIQYLKSGAYKTPWDKAELSNLPNQYAILDIDGNGVEELILFGPAYFEPWNNYMVFTCNVDKASVIPVEIINDNPHFCYNQMYHSAKYKSLVFGCMSPMGGCFARDYYALQGGSFKSIGYLMTQYAGGNYQYIVSLTGSDNYVSKSVYDQYNNELVPIAFAPLPN